MHLPPPEVPAAWSGQLFVNVSGRLRSCALYRAQRRNRAERMLIKFVPITAVRLPCLLGATLGQNPFQSLNVNVSSPLFVSLEQTFTLSSVDRNR